MLNTLGMISYEKNKYKTSAMEAFIRIAREIYKNK